MTRSLKEALSKGREFPRLVALLERDTQEARRLTRELEGFGFTVRYVPDPEALIDEVVNAPPEALLIGMSGNDDDEAAARAVNAVREILDCPLIALGATGDFKTRVAAVRAGSDGFFEKATPIGDLVDTLDQLTRREEGEPLRVLIVEGSANGARRTETVLQAAGMITATLSDPGTITERTLAFAPEAILLDLHMPDCSGRDVASVIRQQRSSASIPIVFLSNETGADARLAATAAGGDDVLSKTVSAKQLVTAVRAHARRFRGMRSLLVHDGLTGLLTYSAFMEALDGEIGRSVRSDTPLTVTVVDLDLFRDINESHGHHAADDVLKSLARLLRQRLRKTDALGRLGSDEFGIVLPGSKAEDAVGVIENIREVFAQMRHTSPAISFSTTLSGGIAAFPETDTAQHLIDAARQSVIACKQAGRNRVIVGGGV
ncbi:MAG: diguanylate cyclase [Rhodospirillales bacterium]|nr:diguanylate cyclase [Rhodospirillales bacterium]